MHHSALEQMSIWHIHGHDIRLVLAAAFICILATYTSFTVLDRVRTRGHRSIGWLLLCAATTGTGAWATHFISMLSYQPEVPVSYDVTLTIASFMVVTFLSLVSVTIVDRKFLGSNLLSGMLTASGITSMHYIGMAAMSVPGMIVWNIPLVALSIVACLFFSVSSVLAFIRRRSVLPWRPAALLFLAVCSLHFTGMMAAEIVPDGRELPTNLMDRTSLAALVIAGAVLVVASGIFVVLFDRIVEREKAASAITHLAYYDTLTGLSNRSVLERRLPQELELAELANESLAVLCIDLDGFKLVNDTYGHNVGDGLLVQVASRLKSVVRADDLVARLGGDEFIVVQRGGEQPESSRLMADRIVDVLSQTYLVGGSVITIGASVGVSIFPKDTTSVNVLLRKADEALYHAKENGKNKACFFGPSIEATKAERRKIELSLDDAVSERQLSLLYQSIVNLADNSVVGFEALLRWQHPELGSISPGRFIEVAEERGLIDDIGMWVLRRACFDAASWDPSLTVAVNYSPLQFLKDDLPEKVESVLEEAKLAPNRLQMEVTEHTILAKPQKALQIMNRLKKLGVRITLDDFGTGYSALRYFQEFPFDKVKIDRTLVSDLSNIASREIVRSIIDLSYRLEVTASAECVETIDQSNVLQSLGCQEAQGFFFSRPQPNEELMEFRRRIAA